MSCNIPLDAIKPIIRHSIEEKREVGIILYNGKMRVIWGSNHDVNIPVIIGSVVVHTHPISLTITPSPADLIWQRLDGGVCHCISNGTKIMCYPTAILAYINRDTYCYITEDQREKEFVKYGATITSL